MECVVPAWRRPLLALCMMAALAACTPHPVGPARTYEKYEGKAVTTAESALSAVETVRLATDSGARGNGFGPYLSVLVSDQEDALAGTQGTFASVQPPDEKADELRDELDQLLTDALDHVSKVRIAVRRGELERLGEMGAPLAGDADALRRFKEAHS